MFNKKFIDIRFSFGLTGPSFRISGLNKNWDITCDLTKRVIKK